MKILTLLALFLCGCFVSPETLVFMDGKSKSCYDKLLDGRVKYDQMHDDSVKLYNKLLACSCSTEKIFDIDPPMSPYDYCGSNFCKYGYSFASGYCHVSTLDGLGFGHYEYDIGNAVCNEEFIECLEDL